MAEKIKNFLDILGQSLAIKIEGELKMKPQGLIMFISADKKAKGRRIKRHKVGVQYFPA